MIFCISEMATDLKSPNIWKGPWERSQIFFEPCSWIMINNYGWAETAFTVVERWLVNVDHFLHLHILFYWLPLFPPLQAKVIFMLTSQPTLSQFESFKILDMSFLKFIELLHQYPPSTKLKRIHFRVQIVAKVSYTWSKKCAPTHKFESK